MLMPHSAPRPCTYPGCRALVTIGRCDKHRGAADREVDERRGSSHARGYTSKWRAARAVFLRANPLCAEHQRNGQVMPAEEVDHIVPHRGDMRLMWSRSNWQPLCKSCHSRKTATEDSGFASGGARAGRVMARGKAGE